MRYFLIFLTALFSYVADAKTITVAVVDTGFGYNMESLMETHLCKYGHKDFTGDNEYARVLSKDKVPVDFLGHGTNVVGLIDKYAGKEINYCVVIIKWYTREKKTGNSDANFIKAIKYAINIKPDVINISGGGPDFYLSESKAFKSYLNNGGIVVAAAGNNSEDLDNPNNHFYPAMYDPRIIVVGNIYPNGVRVESSNYGKVVKYWEVGYNAKAFGISLLGTSQACAIHTGKIVNKLRK